MVAYIESFHQHTFRYDNETELIFKEEYNSNSNKPYGFDVDIFALVTGNQFDEVIESYLINI